MTNSKEVSVELSRPQMISALAPYGIRPTDELLEKILAYVRILVKWNRIINLTTITNPVEIVGRHFGESMFATNVISVEKCRLADVGTGAGFPGMALKILCPEIHLTLIESNKKKSAFLSEVVRTLGLTQVEILTARFEEIAPEELRADFITARALGGFSDLLKWSSKALTRRGHAVLWVGGEDVTRITNIDGWAWNPPVRIPDSQRRYLLTGRYVGNGVDSSR